MLSGDLPRHALLLSRLDTALMGLQKPGDRVRPIAINEVWYRLTSTCALVALGHVRPVFAPLPLVLGVSGGVNVATHVLRSAVAADKQAMPVSLDVKSVYNAQPPACVRCGGGEAAIAAAVLGWAYGAPMDLHNIIVAEGTAPMKSQAGVR